MGICMSVEDKAERDESLRIDRELEEDQKRLKRECKILLLGKKKKNFYCENSLCCENLIHICHIGSGESGKSTIVKQMKIIHQNGYSKEELLSWKLTIFKNILESIQIIIRSIKKFDYEFETFDQEVFYLVFFLLEKLHEFHMLL
jgi:guanine nucleotide-binding protein subunit alpha